MSVCISPVDGLALPTASPLYHLPDIPNFDLCYLSLILWEWLKVMEWILEPEISLSSDIIGGHFNVASKGGIPQALGYSMPTFNLKLRTISENDFYLMEGI